MNTLRTIVSFSLPIWLLAIAIDGFLEGPMGGRVGASISLVVAVIGFFNLILPRPPRDRS